MQQRTQAALAMASIVVLGAAPGSLPPSRTVHFPADRSESNYRHAPPAHTPWPHTACQLILNPFSFPLSLQHQMKAARDYQQATDDELGDRRSLDTAGVRDGDVSCRQLFQWKNADSRCGGVYPA